MAEKFSAPVECRLQSVDRRVDELMAKLLSIEEGSVSAYWAEHEQLGNAGEDEGVGEEPVAKLIVTE